MEKIKVVIADDSEVYLQGLKNIIECTNGVQLCGSAKDGRALVEMVGACQPQVVVTDVQMPVMNGIEATREIKAHYPHVRVIGLTMYSAEVQIVEMVEAGALGYLDKYTVEKHLEEAIRDVHAGIYYYCPTTTRRLSQLLARSKAQLVYTGVHLTDVEKRVVQLVCKGYSAKEISGMVYLSTKTVETYRYRIQNKIGVKGLPGLVIYAMRNGLLDEQ